MGVTPRGGPPRRDLGRSGAGVSSAVGTAVWMNTLSPQTTGVELPLPGSLTFHLMFSVSLQVTGGSPVGAPLVLGDPGQLPPPLEDDILGIPMFVRGLQEARTGRINVGVGVNSDAGVVGTLLIN